MLATLLSATLYGLDGRPVRVEVDVAPGLPGLTIVGLADAALQEARERVRGAIRNRGYTYPARRITVNLAPADLRKAGAALDLAIALGILVGSEQVRATGRWAVIGELSLGGELHRPAGLLPMVACLAGRGVARVIVPASGAAEAGLVPGIEVHLAGSLADAVEMVQARSRGRRALHEAPARVELAPTAHATGPPAIEGREWPDLVEVRGQLEGRRALEIAVAGGHGLLLVGPPGSGKTLLARTIPGILPPLDDHEALEATIVSSVAGAGEVRELVRRRPFRHPHHTISYAGMVGGGPRLSPGEVTLAHRGTLFLDELPEFDRDVLEALREPLEDGRVVIARVGRNLTFPAEFQLVAAMNPCPCGYAGAVDDACRCPTGVAARYRARISGPLRDRLDLVVVIPRVSPETLLAQPTPEASAPVADRVARSRERQLARTARLNGRLSGRALRASCRLTSRSVARLVELAELDGLSARGTDRLMRVARTIADLEDASVVSAQHLDEAARFRGQGLRALAGGHS